MGLVVIGILNGSITTALTVFIVNLDVSAFGSKVSASLFHKRSCFLATSICGLLNFSFWPWLNLYIMSYFQGCCRTAYSRVSIWMAKEL